MIHREPPLDSREQSGGGDTGRVGERTSDMRAKIEIPSYITCIVIEVLPFESRIVDERHFQTLEDAQAFQKSVPEGMIAVIARV